MAVDKQLYTLDEYHAFIDRPENQDRIFELIDGELIEKHSGYFPKNKHLIPQEFAPTGLVVEIKSLTNTKRAMRRKAELYLDSGAKIVWLVFPEDQVVEVYVGDEDIKTVGVDGMLDGGDVLPGFSLSVKEIFAQK